jgi:hypothetical protein
MPEDVLQQAGQLLRGLVDSTPNNAEQLPEWYDRAQEFREFLRSNPSLYKVLPHFVHHYLTDADIRSREPEYRVIQQELILPVVVALEEGRVPPSAA